MQDHPNVAITFGTLGHMAFAKGDYVRALKYHERALLILLTALGEDRRLAFSPVSLPRAIR